MDANEFIGFSSKEIKSCGLFHRNRETNDILKVIIVWVNHTIQNNKAMFIVKNIREQFILPYFIEATYNGDKQELYLDIYTKQFKITTK